MRIRIHMTDHITGHFYVLKVGIILIVRRFLLVAEAEAAK